MMDWLLVLPIVVPITTAALCLMAWRHPEAQRRLGLIGAVALLGVGVALLAAVATDGPAAVQMGAWPAPFGITIAADLFSAVLVLLTGLVGFGVSIYALGDLGAERETYGFHPLFHALLTGVCGAFVTGDIFNLYVWFEVMVIASFGLITLGGYTRQIDGGVKYVLLNLMATTFLLVAIGLLYGLTGTLNMADLALVAPAFEGDGRMTAVAVLFLIAFAMKAAAFPLHFWLPASYHTPAVAVSAIFSGLLTKVGVYSLIRTYTLIFTAEPGFTHQIVLWVGAITMLVGILGAISQSDIRRIFAFNLVSGIGFILIGVGLNTVLGLTGALFYTVHHIVVMAALFLASGVAQRMAGAFTLETLGGLYRDRPYFALVFFVLAMSLAGVPPLSGFWPKVLLVKASLDAEAYWIAAIALVTSLLTLYTMGKVWALAFWRSRSASAPQPAGVPEIDLKLRPGSLSTLAVPVVALATISVIIGLWAEPLMALSGEAAVGLLDPRGYISAVLGPSG